ncbi:hypothetical protein EK21DRAFT_109373 [Setomelanomma holmii]|uniref:Uncharacterized protein n=1 Tax=Setomelanomma holmii TaxID=210430 RepID=A0A9P4HD85_9PLEO|nr:hypothetical protein EK21DRAFT_109373 [Setomelanomma holmii]
MTSGPMLHLINTLPEHLPSPAPGQAAVRLPLKGEHVAVVGVFRYGQVDGEGVALEAAVELGVEEGECELDRVMKVEGEGEGVLEGTNSELEEPERETIAEEDDNDADTLLDCASEALELRTAEDDAGQTGGDALGATELEDVTTRDEEVKATELDADETADDETIDDVAPAEDDETTEDDEITEDDGTTEEDETSEDDGTTEEDDKVVKEDTEEDAKELLTLLDEAITEPADASQSLSKSVSIEGAQAGRLAGARSRTVCHIGSLNIGCAKYASVVPPVGHALQCTLYPELHLRSFVGQALERLSVKGVQVESLVYGQAAGVGVGVGVALLDGDRLPEDTADDELIGELDGVALLEAEELLYNDRLLDAEIMLELEATEPLLETAAASSQTFR